MGSILYGIAVVLFILWLIGLAFHVLGAAIHILLVLAIIAVVWNLVMGRRSAV